MDARLPAGKSSLKRDVQIVLQERDCSPSASNDELSGFISQCNNILTNSIKVSYNITKEEFDIATKAVERRCLVQCLKQW